jgi:hypothetical protein
LRIAEIEELFNTIGMAAAVKGRLQIDVEHPFDHLPSGEPLREGDDVGIVVTTRELGRVRFVDGSAANSGDLVRGHRDAQARAAYDDAAIGATGRYGFTYGVAVLRVIDRRRIVRAEVEHLVSFHAQNLRDTVFVFEAGVIGTNGNLHDSCEFLGEGNQRRAVEHPTPMKLACASSVLHRRIECGDLTQLEFLDLCARELACDGVVLDVRHFPRTDDDYLAQIKKMATDRGLSIAALADSGFFGATQERMAEVLAQAAALGAPLVAGRLTRQIDDSWSDQLSRLRVAASLAKAVNVTLALRNAADTFAAGTHDCKRVAKEADSAWLRFGPEPQALDTSSDPQELAPNTVLLWSDVRAENERSIRELLGAFADFRGHLALDDFAGEASDGTLRAAMRVWRAALSPQAVQ